LNLSTSLILTQARPLIAEASSVTFWLLLTCCAKSLLVILGKHLSQNEEKGIQNFGELTSSFTKDYSAKVLYLYIGGEKP